MNTTLTKPAATPARGVWVPVADRLPLPYLVVLAKTEDANGVIREQMLHRGNFRDLWYIAGTTTRCGYRPTHWLEREVARAA